MWVCCRCSLSTSLVVRGTRLRRDRLGGGSAVAICASSASSSAPAPPAAEGRMDMVRRRCKGSSRLGGWVEWVKKGGGGSRLGGWSGWDG